MARIGGSIGADRQSSSTEATSASSPDALDQDRAVRSRSEDALVEPRRERRDSSRSITVNAMGHA